MKTNQGDIELQEIQVNKAVEDNRCECWKYNVGEQFPMKSVKKESGKCIVEVGPPHEGYSIETSIINWKMEGESKILSKDNIVIATLVFVDGVATGPCKLYDESGLLYYEGYLENGYRQGSGKEYDVSGNVVSEGFYDKGKRIKMVRMKEMKRYWKKYDEKGKLISVSKRDIYGREKGICYFYDEEGRICRISEWKKGKEIGDCGYCEIYDENRKIWYKGYYSNGIQHGYGAEYDNQGKLLFEGFYNKGKKTPMYRMNGNKIFTKRYDDNGKLISISQRNEHGKREGICYFYDENEKICRISEWKEGKEIGDSGYCKIFDEHRKIWYIGYYSKGIQHGYGAEYDDHGKLLFEGFYNEGSRMPICRMYRNNEYWNEYDNKGKLICISKRNNNGRKEGKCYFYDDTERISQVSEWKNGEEISVIKKFNGSKMIEYKNGIRFYEGGYRDSINEDYPYEGEGREFAADGVTVVYRGGYRKGKRHGKGLTYRRMRVKDKGYWVNGVKIEYHRIVRYCFGFSILLVILSLFLVLVSSWLLPTSIIIMFFFFAVYLYFMLTGANDFDKQLFSTLYKQKNDRLVLSGHRYYYACSFIPPQYQYKSITVKSNCFPSVSDVYISGLSKLEKLSVEHNSFTNSKNGNGKIISKVFQVSNCERLQWIEIGQFSFSDFAGDFELKDLPCLQYLKIGFKDYISNNFVYSSFVVRSNE